MKILNLSLDNFRKISPIAQPAIEFNQDVNVLVGSNNTGKTSILKAIQKLFQAQGEAIQPESDLNYLVKDGQLVISAQLRLTKAEWASFTKATFSDQFLASISQQQVEVINQLPQILEEATLNFKTAVTFINRKAAQHATTAELSPDTIEKLHLESDFLGFVMGVLQTIQHTNFFNISKTPLYLDSRGQASERELFVPLIQLENNSISHNGATNIRGLLYTLKKKEPARFDEFKHRLLEIFTELEDIDIIHNEDVGEFQMVLSEKMRRNGNSEQVNYDFNNVGLGMQSLVIMMSHILLYKPGIVLMDEPEVHMHPSLIKEFIKYLRALSVDTQFIITTHSIVLIQEVGIEKVFSLKNDPVKKGIVASAIYDNNQFLEAIDALGYNIDMLAYTIQPSVFVFTEGKSDQGLILAFADKAGHRKSINASTVAFVEMEGKGNRYKLAELLSKLNEKFMSPPVLMILDKDETSQDNIEDIRNKFFSKNPRRLHYLNKRQIENYLIDPAAIRRTVSDKIKNAALMERWNSEPVEQIISNFAEEQKDKILDNFLTETFINESVIGTAQVRDLVRSLVNAPLNEAVPQFTGELFKLIGTRTALLGQKTTSGMTEFEYQWKQSKLDMIDGRVLLKRIRRWVQEEYKVSFTNEEIIYQMDNVPQEIFSLVSLLSNPAQLALPS